MAVTLDGDMVVDIWGGWVDEARTRPWERDTITNVWSTTKTMTALCALMLVDAGEIDLEAPVSRYWPEFGAGGKEGRVLFRHLLGHTAGLPGWSEPMTVEDLYDWEKATSLLAAQEPWWEPGTASGYHAVTQGYLIGEVVRRVTGQSIGTFFREKVSGPLGADFHIGLDPAEFGRVSNVIPPPPLDPHMRDQRDGAARAGQPAARGGGVVDRRLAAGRDPGRQRSGQRPVGGRHPVRRRQRRRGRRGAACCRPRAASGSSSNRPTAPTWCSGCPIRMGTGYGLPSPEMPISTDARACFWGGWGGSVVVNDFDARLTVAYMMNKMGAGLVGDERGIGLILAAQAALSS